MSKSIKVSPKHGLNPCMPVCFFCGKERNEIVLFGKIGREDKEAPMKAVVDFEPCDECKKKFAEGVLLIEVTQSPEYIGMPIAPDAYPTGRYVVVKPEALNGDIFKAGSKALVHKKDFIAMFGDLS